MTVTEPLRSHSRHKVVNGYQEVGEIDGKESIERYGILLAPVFNRSGRRWCGVGIPDAAALAGRIAQLAAFCGDKYSESGGLLVERRGDRWFLMADRKLHSVPDIMSNSTNVVSGDMFHVKLSQRIMSNKFLKY